MHAFVAWGLEVTAVPDIMMVTLILGSDVDF